MREKFESILEKHGIYGEDPEEILYAVQDMFECVIDEIKEKEPYAVVTIRNLENAAYEVFSLAGDL